MLSHTVHTLQRLAMGSSPRGQCAPCPSSPTCAPGPQKLKLTPNVTCWAQAHLRARNPPPAHPGPPGLPLRPPPTTAAFPYLLLPHFHPFCCLDRLASSSARPTPAASLSPPPGQPPQPGPPGPELLLYFLSMKMFEHRDHDKH